MHQEKRQRLKATSQGSCLPGSGETLGNLRAGLLSELSSGEVLLSIPLKDTNKTSK